MMYIEGHWETVDTLEDVVRVIREYYNNELADALDELIPDNEFSEADIEELEELRGIVEEIKGLVM